MKKIFVVVFFFCFYSFSLLAQDLLCRVQVLSRSSDNSITQDDRRVFDDLQRNLTEFINNRKWTNNVIQPNERIECNLIINITEKISVNEFKGTAQIQSSRPVYGTSYQTTLFNYNDENWRFNYTENQALEFSETIFQSNLTALVAYYINIILGFDYDSFAPMGGTDYFLKAQNIVNQCQNLSGDFRGWKAFESNRNRYWLVENALNSSFKKFREASYTYHRLGMDVLANNIDNGRNQIQDLIPEWQRIAREKPNSMIVTLFFNAKSDEIANLFSQMDPSQKGKIISSLSEIDPANINKYQAISGVKR